MISIIVPVYNVDEYLSRCVESLINQTYKDIEIILVDDGSTDKSGELCDELGKKESRIQVIHKKNGGLSDARNVGLDNAHGEYIGFVDSDDYIHPQMFEILMNSLIETNSDVSLCDIASFNINEENPSEYITEYKKEIFEKDAIYSMISSFKTEDIVVWNKLYKREIFNKIRFEKGRIHEDIWILPNIIIKSSKIVKNKIALYYYFQRESSLSKKQMTQKRAVDLIEGLNNTCKILKEKKMYSIQKEMARHAINNAINIYGELIVQGKNWTADERKQYKQIYNGILKENENVISKRQINGYLFKICPYIGYKLYKYRSR